MTIYFIDIYKTIHYSINIKNKINTYLIKKSQKTVLLIIPIKIDSLLSK